MYKICFLTYLALFLSLAAFQTCSLSTCHLLNLLGERWISTEDRVILREFGILVSLCVLQTSQW